VEGGVGWDVRREGRAWRGPARACTTRPNLTPHPTLQSHIVGGYIEQHHIGGQCRYLTRVIVVGCVEKHQGRQCQQVGGDGAWWLHGAIVGIVGGWVRCGLGVWTQRRSALITATPKSRCHL